MVVSETVGTTRIIRPIVLFKKLKRIKEKKLIKISIKKTQIGYLPLPTPTTKWEQVNS